METALKKNKQNKYDLTVEIGKEELSDYIKKTEENIGRDVQIDGFRKGKAPKEKVREQIGEQKILETAMDMAVQDSLGKAIKKQEIEVLKATDLKIKENSASKLVYTVVLTVFPEIMIGDVEGVKVKRKDVQVEEKDISETLEYIRNSRAKLAQKDGVAEKGDRVEVDFEVTSNGLPIEGGVSKNHPVVIGDNKFIPGFEEQLIGMEKDENKKFNLNTPKEYFHKDIAGKNLDFNVKVINIQRIEKPELNDEFAKGLGQFNSMEELKDNVSKGILEEKKMKEKQRVRIEILAGISEKSKIEVPDDLVEERINAMLTNFDNDLHAKGMELSLYLTHLNKTEDDLKKDWRPEAEKQVKFSLLLQRIAKDNQMQVSADEVEQAANQTLQTMTLRGQINQNSDINIENLKEAVASDLVNEKVFTFLESKHVI